MVSADSTFLVVDRVFDLSRYALKASKEYVPKASFPSIGMVVDGIEKKFEETAGSYEELLKKKELQIHDMVAESKTKLEGAVETKITNIKSSVKTTVDGVLHATEKAIDTYLPKESDDEEDEEEFQDATDVELDNASSIVEEAKTRVYKISGVASRRVRKRALSAVERIKVAKLQSAIPKAVYDDIARRADGMGIDIEETKAYLKTQGEKAYAYADEVRERAASTYDVSVAAIRTYTSSASEYAEKSLVEPARAYAARVSTDANEKYAASTEAIKKYLALAEESVLIPAREYMDAKTQLAVDASSEYYALAQSRVVDPAVAKAQDARKALEAKYALALKTFAESRTKAKYVEVKAIAEEKLNAALAAFAETKAALASTMSAESLRNMTLRDAFILAKLYSQDSAALAREKLVESFVLARAKLAKSNPKVEEALSSFVDTTKLNATLIWETRVQPAIALLEEKFGVQLLAGETVEVVDSADYIVDDVIVRKESDDMSHESSGVSEKPRTLSADDVFVPQSDDASDSIAQTKKDSKAKSFVKKIAKVATKKTKKNKKGKKNAEASRTLAPQA